MKFLLTLFLAFAVCLAETSSTTSSTKTTTLVWVTGTDSAGLTATTQSAYTQKFSSMYTSVATYESGSIGLGSLSGEVGDIRTYDQYTVSQANGGARLLPSFAGLGAPNSGTLGLALAVVVPVLAVAVM